jgi:polysaccharide biosynthesis protein PslG
VHPTSALLVTLVIALTAGFAPAAATAAEKGVETDLTWGVGRKKQDRTVADVQELGANWMRLTMSWADVEQTRGSYSALSQYDTAIAKAANSGARIVIVVSQSPEWASGLTNPDSPPADPQDYASFMRFAAARWGDKVDAWEIWNEPNSTGSWSTGPNPAGYARLLKAAYPAVKIADPTARVVYGGVFHNDYDFIERSYAAERNLGDYYDVMATHPYPTPENISPAITWLESDGGLGLGSFSAYRQIRAVMLVNGDDKPIWLTEFGWATTTLAGLGVSEATQAAYLTLAMQCLEQDPYVEVAIWHIYRNEGSEDTWLAQRGLVRTGFVPKPAYDAFKSYTPGNTGCTYRYEDPTPLQPYPEPTPEPKPTPTPDLPADDDPADVTQSEDDGIQSSSVRRKVEIELVRLARAGGSKTRNRVLMRVVGVVSHTHRGRVDLHLTCHARGDRDWRRSLTRRLDVSRAGEYGTRIKPRRRAACSMRASYYAFGQRLGRSPVLRFKA